MKSPSGKRPAPDLRPRIRPAQLCKATAEATSVMMFTHWEQVPEDFPPCVYFLADSRTPNAPRYVGSSRALRTRFKKHSRPTARHGVDAELWFTPLFAAGQRPVLRVVQSFATVEEARRLEWRLALRWARRGVQIFGNHCPPTDDEGNRPLMHNWSTALPHARELAA